MTARERRLDVPAVLRFLNGLRREGLISDYVFIGGVAAMRYTEPYRTKDVDVVILLDDTWKGVAQVWSAILERAGGQTEEGTIVVAGTRLDVAPTGRDAFHEDVLREAHRTRVAGVPAKVARPEHLVAMSLRAWRPSPDFSRIMALLPHADQAYLDRLLGRFDDFEGTLKSRLDRLLALR